MSETDAKACRHTWTDRCKLGRRLEDALRCTECDRITHWYSLHKEQSERLARYEAALRFYADLGGQTGSVARAALEDK